MCCFVFKQVLSTSFEVQGYSTYTGDVTIDSTVGNSTAFTFTWSQYNIAINVVLEAPSGCTYSTNPAVVAESCAGHPLAVIDTDFKIVTFPLPGTAEVYMYSFINVFHDVHLNDTTKHFCLM